MSYIRKILEEKSKAGAGVLENYQNIMHRLAARVLPPSAISGKTRNLNVARTAGNYRVLERE